MQKTYSLLTVLFCSFFWLASCEQKKETKYERVILSDNWKVQPADSASGEWYDASLPATVMGVLTANGLYSDSFVGTNIKNIDRSQFDKPWWYKTDFHLNKVDEDQHVFLSFDGISYYANIWLNGELIASKDSVYGAYRRHSFDVTPYVKEVNHLTVEVYKAQPGDPNIGFADWNPRPADENMGIFREVYVTVSGKARLVNPYIQSKVNTSTLSEAWLTVSTEVQNLTEESVSVELLGRFETGQFSFPIALAPYETKQIRLTSDEIEALHVKNPRLWWCNNLGSPELYSLNLSLISDDVILSQDTVTFGIREIETYFTEDGHRGFMLNGRKILLKSAGWTDDIYLRNTPESDEVQIQYIKDMNLNMVRFENFWGTSRSVYELCDRYGLLSIVGWSCQWEWETYFGKPCCETYGCVLSAEDIDLIAQSFADHVVWLRNHPSIMAWMPGSDMLPAPELEKKYLSFLKEHDNRPYVGAAKKRTSELSGETGTKMAGPYEYVGPNYWYIDTLFGGAFGFNTETGIGAQLPVLESICRFIPEEKLWPIGETWNFHCTTSGTAMNSLSELTKVMDNKYGKAKDLEDYLLKADLINYDGTRAMFEAFRVNLPHTTGIVQWMLNSAWPSLYWQLYDYYQVPTAAYYSVKKANNPIQLIYNYGNNSIFVVNEQTTDLQQGKAVVQVFGMDSKLRNKQEIGIDVSNNVSQQIFSLEPLSENVFLNLELYNEKGERIADNFYCLSNKADEYLWEETDWVYTPAKSYADFGNLSNIPIVDNVNVEIKKTEEKGLYMVELSNPSDFISFFNSLKLKTDEETIVIPTFWSDNYISLLPGQKKTITCKFKNTETRQPYIEIKAWNSPTKKIPLQ